jgi:glycosyl transferase family 1
VNRRLVLCAKSAWSPAIRREHAIASLAAARGCAVTFVEAPRDVRSLAELGLRRWAGGLLGSSRREQSIELIARTTVTPGHRGGPGGALETRLLSRILEPHDRPGTTVVATTPWQWPSVAGLRRARRVLDCADDWTTLIGDRRAEIDALLARAAHEADGILAATAQIADLFAGRAVSVVRNGTDRRMLATPLAPPPAGLVMGYAGTLTERLDTDLLGSLLRSLPDWRIELHGECRYAGCRDRPAPELARLLAEFPSRASWLGVVGRDELASRLDRARVLILPHRRTGAVRGDSMKLYDYAARGRPIISTFWAPDLDISGPPGMTIADSAEDFAAAVVSAAGADDREQAARRRAWAASQEWAGRWDAWSAAAFGSTSA